MRGFVHGSHTLMYRLKLRQNITVILVMMGSSYNIPVERKPRKQTSRISAILTSVIFVLPVSCMGAGDVPVFVYMTADRCF